MSCVCDSEFHTANTVIVEVGFTGKCDKTILTFDGLVVRRFYKFRDLLEQMFPHTVGPTVPFGRRGKRTVFKGALKGVAVCGGRLCVS